MRFPAALGVLLLTASITVRVAAAANSPAPGGVPAQGVLLAHKALYNLTLDSAKSNDVIAAKGTMGYEVTDACDGWAVRHRMLRDGRRQILSFILPGDVFGLCGSPDGVALCGAAALTAVTVAPMPIMAEALRRGHQTALGRLAYDQLIREETFLCNQIVRLGRQMAHERLISLLLEFHSRLRQVHLTQESSFVLPLTQEVLSDALGLSVVHTNRTLQQLKREHLVASNGNSIKLSDLTRLSELSD